MSAKTIFITGASTGVGLASAKLFYKHGWNIVATMRSPEKATELKQLDAKRVLIQRLDVQETGSIQPAVDAAIARFARIDLLLNNAGFAQNGLFEKISRERIQEQFNVNVFGVMDTIRAFLPHFKANKGGTIINVSSGNGLYGLPMMSAYSASKFALEGFTESLSYELASLNIIVKSVIPQGGILSTNFVHNATEKLPTDTPLEYTDFMGKVWAWFGGMGSSASLTSDSVAQVILEAATDGTRKLRYVTIGGDCKSWDNARYTSKDDEEYMNKMRTNLGFDV